MSTHTHTHTYLLSLIPYDHLTVAVLLWCWYKHSSVCCTIVFKNYSRVCVLTKWLSLTMTMISGANCNEIWKGWKSGEEDDHHGRSPFPRELHDVYSTKGGMLLAESSPVSPLLTPLLGRRQRSYVVVATTMIGVRSKSNFEILVLFLLLLLLLFSTCFHRIFSSEFFL